VRQRDPGQDIYFGRRNRLSLPDLIPADLILASSGEEDFFVKKSRKAAFEPKTFLAKVGDGKTITEYYKDQVVFSQGSEADAVFYIQKGKIKLTVVSDRGKEAVVGILEPGHFFWRRMSEWPSTAGRNGYGDRSIPDYAHPQSSNDCYLA